MDTRQRLAAGVRAHKPAEIRHEQDPPQRDVADSMETSGSRISVVEHENERALPPDSG
jgi:hypothetical protein